MPNCYFRFVAASLAMIFGTAAWGQISQANLEGTIKDNSGAVIPGAAVTLRNKGTAASRSATTDAAGQYAIPNLDPAEYTLTVAYQGCKTCVISSLTLHTGERSTLDASLELGDTTQEVTVEAA